MKRILVFISMLLCLSAVYSQNDITGQCGGGPGGCKDQIPTPAPTQHVGASGSIPVLRSCDPNEVIGPEGYDSVRWVSINDVLNYTILFENDPVFASAAAQKVDVRFNFPNKALMKGFGISNYGFSNMSFTVDKPSNAYQNRIDLKDSLGIYVDLIGGLDVTKQQGFWTFTTIDPETGYAPWEPEKGMLPVNDSTHVGEGYVTFQLTPPSSMKTGDTISIVASIVFDQNDTIRTNRWCNKIDAGMPESKIAPLSSPQGGTADNAYELTFTAKDDEGGSGVKHLLLYMANHNGIYEEIDTVAVDSVLLFPVEAGKQYKLYSIAVDNTGNREPAKAEPDVILNFNQAPTDIAISDTIFQDDLAPGGFIGRLTSVDSDGEKTFIYALAEGEGAFHNDLFQITDDQLQIKNTFKCAEDSIFDIRLSTTDEGGLSYSKRFALRLKKVLDRPEIDTLEVNICSGDICLFHGAEYDQTGIYKFTKSNDYACDSVYVLKLNVLEPLDAPLVTTEGTHTLVSSAAKGNQWFHADGTPVEGATDQRFTPTEEGAYYVAATNGSCFSEPSQTYFVKLSDDVQIALDLRTGWNWISSSLSEAANRDAKQFISPIASVTNRLVGFMDELINDPVYGFTGNLTTINPTESYKLQVTEDVNHTWNGLGSDPATTAISLKKGWNWMGYVPPVSNDLAAALSQLQPTTGDIVKNIDDFSTYNGNKWIGTLTEMCAGEGYMYLANNATNFTYPATRVFPVSNEVKQMITSTTDATPWNYDPRKYPDNTTLIGRLLVGEQQALEGTYSVGAFSGNECRGVGKYVDGFLFLTIHGTISADREITFKAYENATGNELSVSETINFNGQHVGSVAAPFTLHVNVPTAIETLQDAGYNVYPRPLRNRLFISGPTDDIQSIHILSANGAQVLTQKEYPVEGIDVAHLTNGVYVVAIVTNNGKVHYEKVLKAQ